MGCSAKYCNEKNYYKYNQENLDLGQLDEPLSPEEKVPIIDENIGQNEKPKKNPNNFPNLNETTVNTLKRYNEWTQLKETIVTTPKKNNNKWTQTENYFTLDDDESKDGIQTENNHKSVEKIERSIQTENNHHDSESESEEDKNNIQDNPQFLSKKRKFA